MNKKKRSLHQKLVDLNPRQILGLFIICMAIGTIILPFVIVPLINSERIWKSELCMIPEGCPMNLFLPQNEHIRNRYELIVLNYAQHYPRFGLITLTHVATSTDYIFNYSLSIGEYTTSTIFIMIPGAYSGREESLGSRYELWEYEIIPKNFDLWVYIGLYINFLTLISVSVKIFQGFKQNNRPKE